MNAHTPFDANQDWSNPYCRNSSNDPLVDALLGNAYHVVRTVYCNLGYIKHLYDFLSQYGVVICVQSEAELKTLTTEAKYARIYDKSPAGDRRVTDYLYVDDDRTGILPDDTTATGSWVKVATSNSGVDSKDGGYIPWVYNSGSATGGETSIRIPDETAGAPFMIVNGDWQTEGYDFEYDPLTFEIKFTTPLEQGDFVVVMRTGVPATPDNPNVSDWVTINWLYNHGAAVGGEQVIDIPYTFQSVPAVYKNGLRFCKGLANNSYTLDSDNNRIILTEPLATNDRLVIQLGGEAKILETVDHTIQEVARAANVKDSEVILSTDTTQVLNGKKVIYDVVSQRIYGLPTLPTNVYINAVADGQLTYSPGNITVTLLDSYQQQNTRELWRRSLVEAGLTLVDGSFEEGATANSATDAVWHIAGGQCYTWGGEFPKIAPYGSTPESVGGVGLGKWASVDDASLRSEVYSNMAWVSPEMYGALDAISAADTQSLIDAFTTAKTMGVGVKLSRLYQCASNIELTAFISDVFGLGQGQTGIIFEPGCGFVVDNSSISGTRKAMRIINTSLRTRGAKDATALRFKGTHSAKYGEQLKLTDVLFATDETGAFGWDCCLHLDQASQVFMDHCSMSGLDAVPTNCCIRLTNQSRDINFTNGCASDFLDFMDVTSGSEGVTVAFNHIIAGQRGVISHDTGGNMLFILGNHFNTSISAVELGEGTGLGSNHCKIANNFCIVYNKPGDESKPYVAFDICSNENVLSSNDVLLTGFTKDATHTRLRRNASASRSASNNTVANPISNGLTRGVVVATGATNNQVYGNQRIGMTLANDIIDNGTNTRFWLLDSDNNAFLTGDIKLARPGMAGVRQLRVHTGLDTTTASGILRFIGGADGVANDAIMESTFREVVTKTIRPSTTNAYSCGVSSAAWSGGFTQTAFTITSDADCKSDPLLMTDAILDAAEEVQFVQYQYLDRIKEKGADGARWHFGAIAQRYVEAFERHGLDAHRFGFICYDEWGDTPAVIDDETGEVITPAIEAGSRYGIRYEEMLVMEAAAQRRKVARLESRIESLETLLSEIATK